MNVPYATSHKNCKGEGAMKKRIVIVTLVMLVVLLTGCGKKEETVDAQTDSETLVSVEVDPIINRDKSLDDEEAVEEQLDEDTNESVKFACKDEIKNASPDSGLVQIDDMLFQYGAKFSEINDQIMNSECTYDAEDYNASSVVPAGEEVTIRFKKNDDTYFMLRMNNHEAETVELGDCIVERIECYEDSTNSIYYAGFSDEELNYNTVKNAMKDYEPDQEIFGSNKRNGSKELGLMYTIPFQEDNFYIFFIFDGVSNELVSFEVNSIKLIDTSWPW